MPVLDEYSRSPLALVQDVIIDPENGKLLVFVVKKNHIITPFDIEHINSALYIADKSRIISFNDVLRAQNVAKLKIPIIRTRVFTQRKHAYIGRVVDYEIDTTHFMLAKIHVAKLFLFLRFQERIIDYRAIIKISKTEIIVKDAAEVEAKEKAVARGAAFA